IDGGYTTTAGSPVVTLSTTTPHGFSEGDTIFLSDPAIDIDGIPATQLGGYFTISNVTANGFEITAGAAAQAGGAFAAAGQVATPSYDTIEAGEYRRTKE